MIHRIRTIMVLESPFKLALSASLVVFLVQTCFGQQVSFDVTKYGAVADTTTDNSKAFSDAWSASCAHEGDASFVVPQGTFLVGPIVLAGPCSNNTSTTIQIQGKLLAPSDVSSVQVTGWIEFRDLARITVNGGGTIDGQGEESWKLKESSSDNLPISLRFIKVRNANITNITLLNSKGVHIGIQRSAYFTIRNITISAPGYSPNTDGIHLSDTNDVNMDRLTIGTGDDCISIGPGTANVTISAVTCNPGHGISIGSLGKYKDEQDVVNVKVTNCTIANADNGVRIKTWPGSAPGQAWNFTFQGIIVQNVSHPILIDQGYCNSKQCSTEPSMIKIKDVLFKDIRGSSNRPAAVSLLCSPSVPCENLQLQNINLEFMSDGASNATSVCTNAIGLTAGIQKPDPCLSSNLTGNSSLSSNSTGNSSLSSNSTGNSNPSLSSNSTGNSNPSLSSNSTGNSSLSSNSTGNTTA